MKRAGIKVFILIIFLLLFMEPAGKFFESKRWVKEAPYLGDYFFKTKEAKKVGDNLLLFQADEGGFPKNIFFPNAVIISKSDLYIRKHKHYYTTIDNDATTTEIIYLAKLYNFTKKEKYKIGAIKGINFLINMQSPNGGYSQQNNQADQKLCLYRNNITFNDKAMVNVLELMQNVSQKNYPFNFVDDETSLKAKIAFDKGIQCILKCQIKQNGVLTAWCAQHDKETLLPSGGRKYEKPSISGKESDEITILLMSIDNPSQEIIDSIEAAVKWFKKSQINGIKREWIVKDNKLVDFTINSCGNCPPVWGRFYDLENNNIFFCDRDGIKTKDISKISRERRVGYEWFNSDGIQVLNEYEKWKQKVY